MEHYKIAKKYPKELLMMDYLPFFKGALARQEEDSFLDLYVLVSDNNAELFLEEERFIWKHIVRLCI